MGNWVSYNTYFDAYYEINPQLNLLSSFWYSGMRYTNENDLEYLNLDKIKIVNNSKISHITTDDLDISINNLISEKNNLILRLL